MTLAPGTEHLLQLLILTSIVLLIPVFVGVTVVLFKLAFLIHSTSDFVNFASNELTPVVKELRLTVDHLETMGHRASSGMQDMGQTLQSVRPLVKTGVARTKTFASALISGLKRSFDRNR